jgi:hypothetical protein
MIPTKSECAKMGSIEVSAERHQKTVEIYMKHTKMRRFIIYTGISIIGIAMLLYLTYILTEYLAMYYLMKIRRWILLWKYAYTHFHLIKYTYFLKTFKYHNRHTIEMPERAQVFVENTNKQLQPSTSYNSKQSSKADQQIILFFLSYWINRSRITDQFNRNV